MNTIKTDNNAKDCGLLAPAISQLNQDSMQFFILLGR